VEVIAVDRRETLVRSAAKLAADAVCLDSTEEAALSKLNPAERDVCVCAIGNEARDASIITTALLRQLGAERVVSRAIDNLHGRILRLVGAHDVVNPEEDFGERFATRLMYSTVLDEIALGDDLVLTELKLPPALAGHTLASLALPRRFGVTVVALRRADPPGVDMPDPQRRLIQGDVLLLVSQRGRVAELLEKIG